MISYLSFLFAVPKPASLHVLRVLSKHLKIKDATGCKVTFITLNASCDFPDTKFSLCATCHVCGY